MYTLSEVCSLITDGSHFSPEDEGTGYPMLSVKDMRDDGFDYSSCKYVGEDAFKTLVENGCKPQINDVVVAKDGSYLKAAFSIKENLNIVLLSSIAILRPKLDILYPDYLSYYFRSEAVYRTVSLNYITGTALKRIILQGIRKLQINLPTIEEQKMIVKKLDKINCLISLRKKQLQKLDDLVKARFVEMFGDPVFNNMCWQTRPLEEVCKTIVDCPHSTPTYTSEDTGYMCIRTSIVKKNHIMWDEIEYIPEDEFYQRIQRKKPEKGDVIYTREGAILGIAAVIDRDCDVALGQRSMLLSPDTKVCTAEFLSVAMNFDSFLNNALKGMSGSASPHINVGDIKVFQMIFPPIEQQRKFSSFAQRVDKSKLSVQQSLEKLETMKQALMQQYFG